METNKQTKTTVFNLIILDESGSMSSLTNATVSGCNEVLNTIKASAEKNADTQRHLTSIYAFQSNGPKPSRYIIKNAEGANLADITTKDYEPYGCTPLLDAVGMTLSEMLTVAGTHEDATGVVTIITDGYENSSTHYDWQRVAKLIGQARELGWTVNVIGADIDVIALAKKMNVNTENTHSFQHTEVGTTDMFDNVKFSICSKFDEFADEDRSMSVSERRAVRKGKSSNFFKK